MRIWIFDGYYNSAQQTKNEDQRTYRCTICRKYSLASDHPFDKLKLET